jgi:hypothetical protein
MKIRLDKKYVVEFVLDTSTSVSTLECIWSPRLPPKKIIRKLYPEYLAARHAFIESITKDKGLKVLVV